MPPSARPWSPSRPARRPTTAITYVGEVRAFFGFLNRCCWLHPDRSYERIRDGLPELIGCVNYKMPRVDDAVALVVTTANVLPLPSADGKYPKPCQELLRDRALLTTLYVTGMHRQEMASLNRADVQDGRTFEGLIIGKGDKERDIFFDEEAVAAIRAYLAVRADTSRSLFLRHDDGRGKPGVRGEHWRLLPQQVWGIVKKYGQLAGVEVTTHQLRHLKARDGFGMRCSGRFTLARRGRFTYGTFVIHQDSPSWIPRPDDAGRDGEVQRVAPAGL